MLFPKPYIPYTQNMLHFETELTESESHDDLEISPNDSKS